MDLLEFAKIYFSNNDIKPSNWQLEALKELQERGPNKVVFPRRPGVKTLRSVYEKYYQDYVVPKYRTVSELIDKELQ